MNKFDKVKNNKYKIFLENIVIIIFYILSSLNILLNIYNGYIKENEFPECYCETHLNIQ